MGFQLTIAEGRDAGKEFVFEQDSVLIGRVSECDVVLYDNGVSRRHCRILLDGDRYVIEDLGSSNGTMVNGTRVSTQEVAGGDQIKVGPVLFSFKSLSTEEMLEEGEEERAGDGNSTRIVSMDALKRQRSRNRGAALAPEGADEEELAAARRLATRAIPAVRERPPRTGTQSALERPPRTGTQSALERAPRGGAQPPVLERAGPSAMAPPRRTTATASALARAAPTEQGGTLSAAERARIRRESSGLGGQMKIFWLEASAGVRNAIIGGGMVLGLGLVAVLYWLVLGVEAQVSRGSEPTVLSGRPIEASFGLGEGVTWERPDMKMFEWEYTAATQALAILHFQARDISEGEVLVTVNGVDVGKVPPDTMASQERVVDIMISPKLLKKGEPNRIVFDNTRNPPGQDAWRVWNIWLEKVLLPDIPPEQLMQEARTAYMRGRKNMDTRAVGARNLYESWKSFREAWLLLEAHPEPKPDLYYDARERVKDAQRELDRVCSKLFLEVESYVNQRNWQAASATLDHISEYFPNENDQRCAWRAQVKREELGL
jgi:hypothetical protein